MKKRNVIDVTNYSYLLQMMHVITSVTDVVVSFVHSVPTTLSWMKLFVSSVNMTNRSRKGKSMVKLSGCGKERDKLYAEGDKLYAEGEKLFAEGNKLRA